MTKMIIQKEKLNGWDLLINWVLGIFGRAQANTEENQFLIE